ncbi:MAG: glycosyltransferase [Acidimicrobiia bacterium]|nr:glycosyltransferase [Acidimicrobiia bacterium]
MRRIAHVSYHTSPVAVPGAGDAGGLNVHVRNVAARLGSRGIDVDIYTRRTDEVSPAEERIAPGVNLVRIAAGPSRPMPKEDLPAYVDEFTAGLAPLVHERDHDIVHSHYWMSGLAGQTVAAKTSAPHVHSFHTLAVSRALPDAGDERHEAERHIAAEADLLVVNTPFEAAVLAESYAADRDRVEVIAPGVDHEVFSPGPKRPARARLGLDDTDLVVLFLGRIQRVKGADVAAEALADLGTRNPQLAARVTLVVAGGPSGVDGHMTMKRMQTIAGDIRTIPDFCFLPARPHHEIVDLYRAADVCVVPSRSESFGLVALEAQACGTPVVASRVGGLPHVVRHGSGGVLVDAQRAGEFGRVLEDVLTDDCGRFRMSMAAREDAAAFSWGRTATRHGVAYCSLLTPDGVAVCG